MTKSAEEITSSRVFHEEAKSYYLPVDQEERERLKFQHVVLKQASGGKILFPPFGSEKNYSVLDSGVGPGAWLSDVASLLSPDSILHGIDISSSQFPNEKPVNVSFSEGSVLALPEEWEKKFHFVHQRLLVAALKRNEWPQAIRGLYRVLQPGGWVQLGEIEEWSAPLGKDSAIARHMRAYLKFLEARDIDLSIGRGLSDLLRDAGFINLSVKVVHIPLGKLWGPIGINGSRNLEGVLRALRIPMVSGGGFGAASSEHEYDKLVDDVVKEWDEIEGYTQTFYIVYGQRPPNTE